MGVSEDIKTNPKDANQTYYYKPGIRAHAGEVANLVSGLGSTAGATRRNSRVRFSTDLRNQSSDHPRVIDLNHPQTKQEIQQRALKLLRNQGSMAPFHVESFYHPNRR